MNKYIFLIFYPYRNQKTEIRNQNSESTETDFLIGVVFYPS